MDQSLLYGLQGRMRQGGVATFRYLFNSRQIFIFCVSCPGGEDASFSPTRRREALDDKGYSGSKQPPHTFVYLPHALPLVYSACLMHVTTGCAGRGSQGCDGVGHCSRQ